MTIDNTNSLSDEQLEELEQLAAEPDQKDTMTLDEFNNATDKWRINKRGKTRRVEIIVAKGLDSVREPRRGDILK